MTQQTTVEGTVPNLDGRWLLLTSVSIGNGPKRTLTSLVEGTRAAGHQQLAERHVVLPAAQNAALQRANDELGGAWSRRRRTWTPSPPRSIGSSPTTAASPR